MEATLYIVGGNHNMSNRLVKVTQAQSECALFSLRGILKHITKTLEISLEKHEHISCFCASLHVSEG